MCRAVLSEGSVLAVKRLHPDSGRGVRALRAEVQSLSRVRQRGADRPLWIGAGSGGGQQHVHLHRPCWHCGVPPSRIRAQQAAELEERRVRFRGGSDADADKQAAQRSGSEGSRAACMGELAQGWAEGHRLRPGDGRREGGAGGGSTEDRAHVHRT